MTKHRYITQPPPSKMGLLLPQVQVLWIYQVSRQHAVSVQEHELSTESMDLQKLSQSIPQVCLCVLHLIRSIPLSNSHINVKNYSATLKVVPIASQNRKSELKHVSYSPNRHCVSYTANRCFLTEFFLQRSKASKGQCLTVAIECVTD